MTRGFDHAASFGQNAAAYARHRPTYPAALFDWLAEQAPTRGLAVDVAAGAGQAALALAERFDRVVATDRSADLLTTIPAHPRLTTLAQPAEELDVGALSEERADLVVTAQALHWFAGEPFWERVRATLRPGGVFAAFGYAWLRITPEVDDLLAAELLPALDPHWSPRNRLLFGGYRGVDIPFAELPAPAFEITLEWTREQLVAYLATWSAVTALREQGVDVLGALAPRLRDVWPGEEARPVSMPLALRTFHV